MRNLAILAAALLLTACMATTPSRQEIAASTQFEMLGATVQSPNQAGWSVLQSTQSGLAFARSYEEDGATTVANTSLFVVDGQDDDADFLRYIATQRRANDDSNRFKIIKVNNDIVKYKNTACLKYSSVSEDHANSGITSVKFQYFKTIGYICRHPANKVIAFQMEVSHRSGSIDVPNELQVVAASFFNGIHFVDNKVR